MWIHKVLHTQGQHLVEHPTFERMSKIVVYLVALVAMSMGNIPHMSSHLGSRFQLAIGSTIGKLFVFVKFPVRMIKFVLGLE